MTMSTTTAREGPTVADLMRTDFRSCNPHDPAAEVAAALRQSRCPALAVTRAQVPIGLVTERALAAALAEHGADLSRLTAADLMADDPPTIPTKGTLDEAADELGASDGQILAVDADGLLKGVLTLAEVGPQLSEAALGRLAARLMAAGAAAPVRRPPAPAEAARIADPTAEIKTTKMQAQPHAWDSPTGAHPEPVPLVTQADLVNPMLRVADAMTTGPRTCAPESTALEAVLILRDAGCGMVPVTEDGRPVGVVTDRDIALALPEHEADLAATPIGRLMTKDLATIDRGASLDAAVEALGGRGVRRLLVVDGDGRLVGVLSWVDLVPHVSERGLGQVVSKIVEHR
jgi:CBS domain-containing protein